jgi:LmbE family N-acetylglucosaminyl deacetylase
LFRNKISLLDKQLIKKLNLLFKTFNEQYDFIVIPVGSGKHVDHLITSTCATQSMDANRLVYYFDAPYFFHLYNWNINNLKKFKNYKLSIKWSSNRKLMAFNCYRSQKHVLLKLNKKIFFNNKIIFFPELVFLPKSWHQ